MVGMSNRNEVIREITQFFGFATVSTVTVARRTVIKRWKNPRGVAVQFGT